MSKITEKAYAKINLFLEVGPRRDDGFHDIDSTMQTVSFYDEIELETTKKDGISFSCPALDIPNEKNLVYRAARFYTDKYNITEGVNIRVTKNIPWGAGLGGGSADGAATLRGMKKLFGLGTNEEMLSLCAKLGSDVPFCYIGGRARCRGRGEIMTTYPTIPQCHIVIVKGDSAVSTKDAYQMLDAINRELTANTNYDLNDLSKISESLFNRFEEVSPYCKKTKKSLLAMGAVSSLLSGSGSAIFGIFNDEARAIECVDNFRQKGWFAAVCRPCSVDNDKYTKTSEI